MKKLLLFAACLVLLSAQAQLNLNLIGTLDYQALHNSDVSDLWGYVDENGTEYAIVGVNDGGVSVVDLSDPTDPQELFYQTGPSSIWRDVVVWNDHAYISTEGGGGDLMIVDLSPLPQNTNLPFVVFDGLGWDTSHNLFVDENGVLYVMGSNRGNGGVIFYDLGPDPMAPMEIGIFDTWYVHDGYARGDTLYAAHVYEGFFSIVDVSDKTAPVLLGTQPTSSEVTHNCWLNGTGDILFTTDETPNGHIDSYDVSDPSNIVFLQSVQSAPGSNTIPHNAHFINDYLVTSYYRYGTTIHDVSRPDNMIEVGYYDSSPLSGPGFNGAWGTYPWLPSGLIITSDVEGGLIVLDPSYVQACWLEGTVIDAISMTPLVDCNVEIASTTMQDVSALDGSYATGYHTAGSYDVTFSRSGYQPYTETGVTLANGVVTQLDVQLQPLATYTLTGVVREAGTSTGVAGAQVVVQDQDFTFTTTTGPNGSFSLSGIYEGDYDITAGAWGWITTCMTNFTIGALSPQVVLELDEGYYDDFAFDFGWSVNTTASNGAWERDEPLGTSFQGTPSNPDMDVTIDCDQQAYVTGNGGGAAGTDDVDDGATVLVSPIMDLGTMADPTLEFHFWFFNAGGGSNPDDELLVRITNSIDTVTLLNVDASSAFMGSWQPASYQLTNFVSLSSTMQLIVQVADEGDGHLVEAGLDLFQVIPDSSVHITITNEGGLSPILYPNPSNGLFNISGLHGEATYRARIFDVSGKMVSDLGVLQSARGHSTDVVPGTYWVRLEKGTGERIVLPLVIGRN